MDIRVEKEEGEELVHTSKVCLLRVGGKRVVNKQ